MAKASPSPNGANGERDAAGRFASGNPGGPGNPHARRVGELRAALLDAVTPADVRAMVEALVSKARSGDVLAIRVLLDRVFGRVTDLDAAAAGEQADLDGLRRNRERRTADRAANPTEAERAIAEARHRFDILLDAAALDVKLPP